MPDPRARNSHHRLSTVLTIAALAVLMGRQRPANFLRLAQQLNARQREALGYYRPPGKKSGKPPGRDVFYTLFGSVEPTALTAVLNEWLQAQHGQLPAALALDGKAVTDRRTIVTAGGEYLIQLKDNAAAVRAAATHALAGQAPLFFTDDCAHGRAEHRELTLATVTPEQLGFPHAATVVAVHSEVIDKKTGQESGETRHFVSSLEQSALTRRRWLARCRNHWKVKSANHYRRDVTWREDQELGRNVRRACNLALLRSALLGVLLRDGSINLSALSQRYASNPAAALSFLRAHHPSP